MRRITWILALVALLAVIVLFRQELSAPAQAQNGATPTPLPLYALPNANVNVAYRSSSIATRPGDSRITAAVNLLNNSVTFAIPSQGRILSEVSVGRDPRSVAFTPNGNFAVVANRADSTLSIIDTSTYTVIGTVNLGGAWAYGVVADDTRAVVSLFGSNQLVVVDLEAQAVTATIPVPAYPAGLVLWGEFVYVSHFWSGEISFVYLPLNRVVQTAQTGADTALFQAIEPDISRGIAYLPQTRLNTDNPVPTFDTLAFPVVNVIDLRNLTTSTQQRIALDSADQPVNMPFAAALDRFAQRLYIANAGSDDVTIIDLNTGETRAHIEVGANPRGLALNADYSLLYVHNALQNTITTIDTVNYDIEGVLPLSSLAVSADVLVGAQLFHSADDRRLSADSWLSCATCHFDGTSDGRTWAGFGNGGVNTPLLYRLPETVPYTWSGAWDELADVETRVRHLLAGTGLVDDPQLNTINASLTGLSPDLDVLVTYLVNLPPPPDSALPSADPAVIDRGAAVFESLGCAACHVGSVGTNLQAVDVGTGGTFDTPSLRWLALSAPYFHDGRAETLDDVFQLSGDHDLSRTISPDDRDALIAYLLAWGEAPPE